MSSAEDYFSAIVACKVCGVTQRMLDHWITTDVFEPTKVFECEHEKRGSKRRKAYHLFDFEGLVRIKIVKNLRDTGVALQRIRYAIKRLQEESGNAWHRRWIVTDGKNLYEVTKGATTLASLMKKEKGQLVFSVIAAKPASDHVKSRLAAWTPFPLDRYNGTLKSWDERTRSA